MGSLGEARQWCAVWSCDDGFEVLCLLIITHMCEGPRLHSAMLFMAVVRFCSRDGRKSLEDSTTVGPGRHWHSGQSVHEWTTQCIP